MSTAAAEQLLQQRGADLSDQDLQRICAATELTNLDLTGCSHLTNAGFSAIANLTELESLSLSRCHRINDQVFAEISKLKKLRRLDLSSTRMNVPRVARWLKQMPSLRELDLKDAPNPKTKGLGEVRQLTHLDISSSNKLTDADLAALAPLTSLVSLNANGSRNYHANGGVTNAGLKHLEGMTSLGSLGLFGYHSLRPTGYNLLFS